jgi:hypothetical protein
MKRLGTYSYAMRRKAYVTPEGAGTQFQPLHLSDRRKAYVTPEGAGTQFQPLHLSDRRKAYVTPEGAKYDIGRAEHAVEKVLMQFAEEAWKRIKNPRYLKALDKIKTPKEHIALVDKWASPKEKKLYAKLKAKERRLISMHEKDQEGVPWEKMPASEKISILDAIREKSFEDQRQKSRRFGSVW